MAGEYLLINDNPRRRRHKARRKKARHVRRRRAASANPHRRRAVAHRRHVSRRRHVGRRRHARRNPAMGGAVAATVMQGLAIGLGAGVVSYAASAISSRLPAQLQSGLGNTAVKAGLGIVALPMILKMTPLRRFAKPVALGATALIAYELWMQYVAPNLPQLGPAGGAPTVKGYGTEQIAGYGTEQISGIYASIYDQ